MNILNKAKTQIKYPLPLGILQDLNKFEKDLAMLLAEVGQNLKKPALDTLKAGGKRLRPALLFLSGLSARYSYEKLKNAAMAVELMHMASLVHDDVLDRADLRRGKPTVYKKYGKHTAIETGDFLFALSFKLLSELNTPQVTEIMAEVSVALSVGELEEIVGKRKLDLKNYLERIENKTAVLFRACCEIGAILAGAQASDVKALAGYGQNIGIAFQMYDDTLDFTSTEETLGKEIGIDLKQGIASLPIILGLANKKISKTLKKELAKADLSASEIDHIIELLKENRVVEEAKEMAGNYLLQGNELIQELKNQKLAKNLVKISDFVVSRYN